MRPLAVMVAAGAVTPVGLRSIDTAFSHRASAAAMRESPLVDGQGEPVTMCFLPTLDPRVTGAARAVLLAERALGEALEKLGPAARGLRMQMGLCLDEHLGQRPPGGEAPAQRVAAELAARAQSYGCAPEIAVKVSTRGPAAPGFLLPELCDALARGTIDAALLGGVHTDYDPARIAALDAAGRLFRPDNLDALVPGECAAFVVLARPDVARRALLRELGQIVGLSTAHERARPDNDESAFQATGLTAALRAALAPLAERGLRAGWVLTDITFETFRHFELQAASVRTQQLFCDPQQLECPAQRIGALGAAAMPLHLAIASEAFARGFAPHPCAVSLAGSDGGERAAMVVVAPG
ncbi:beta-ketoacyl synthase N-terminal-like domain-containing protein [Sorangium sp. So ce128]|uniref:beta-ketoacyl synthase N-terminal-like domain-containing protein n=1 Tax=Sorangium sp. So ce128 TaxID=3133281 RepID=UPI003F6056B8